MVSAASTSVSLGTQAPFRVDLGREAVAVTVEGVVPAWLRGRLVRTAPAVFAQGSWQADHWFDALGMVYGFAIDDDGITFVQRQLASDTARAPERSTGFGTQMTRSLWQRLRHPAPTGTDNTNVNILALGDDLVAFTETERQWVIDPATLHTLRPLAWQDGVAQSLIAHPQYDRARDVVVNVGSVYGKDAGIAVVEHAPGGRVRRRIGMWAKRRVPYVHSFGLTAQHVVLIGHPLDVNPLSMLFSNKGFIDHFQWRPAQGTTIARMDRTSGVVVEHTAPPMFVFHTIQAFEEAGATVVDVIAFDDAQIVSRLRTQSLAAGFFDIAGTYKRLRLVHGRDEVEVTTMANTRFDFPIVNSAVTSTRAGGAAMVWGASLSGSARGGHSAIVKVVADRDVAARFVDDDVIFGEPVFVRHVEGGGREDDGVVLTVGSHRDGQRACLQILDAASLTPLARATIDVPLPLGFHGSFLRRR